MGGDSTAAQGGQVSLNPIPHVVRSPFGMVVVPLLSFFVTGGGMIGWASAPYDPLWERRHPRRAGWMALAGPAANFTLMLLAVIALHTGRYFHLFHRDPMSGAPSLLGITLSVVFSLNLLLGTFNLLPVPPLDGSAGILVLMSEKRRRATWTSFEAATMRWRDCSWRSTYSARFIRTWRQPRCGCFSR